MNNDQLIERICAMTAAELAKSYTAKELLAIYTQLTGVADRFPNSVQKQRIVEAVKASARAQARGKAFRERA